MGLIGLPADHMVIIRIPDLNITILILLPATKLEIFQGAHMGIYS